MANHQNPIAILVPCHRVIGKDGSMIGYGGGLDRKEWLLRHEGVLNQLFFEATLLVFVSITP
jgi:methylated-DNA-[protein]-cysteine S-methyltransferase